MRTATAMALLPQAANPRTNPDGLPIGLSKKIVTEGRWKGESVGPNCAACHNAQLNYKGKRIRIDGGDGNTFDLMAYVNALDDAIAGNIDGYGKVRSPGYARSERRVPTPKSSFASALRSRPHGCITIAPAPRPRQPLGARPHRCHHLIVNRLMAVNPAFRRTVHSFGTDQNSLSLEFRAGSWTQWRGTQQDPLQRNSDRDDGCVHS